jgi:thioredoxin 1
MVETVQVSDENFQSEVLDVSLPVLVDFSAVWCGPCKMLEPIISELSKDWEAKVKVVKLDVDLSPETAMRYQVMGVPTLILFVKGKVVERITGYQPKDRIEQKFNPHIS